MTVKLDTKKTSILYDMSNVKTIGKIASHSLRIEEILEIIHFNEHVLWIRNLKFREDKASLSGDIKF